jgi:hypothetical protein
MEFLRGALGNKYTGVDEREETCFCPAAPKRAPTVSAVGGSAEEGRQRVALGPQNAGQNRLLF